MENYGKMIRLAAGSMEIDVAPEAGFSLMGLRRKGVEILNPGPRDAFNATRKGYGPLILPHFNQAGYIPEVGLEAFPHVRELEKIGITHPFQHGIGRYVPWEFSSNRDSVTGRLDGKMRVRGFALSELTGFDFSAAVVYRLDPEGLEIAFDIQGEKPVAAGIHFYYNLFDRAASRIFPPSCLIDAPSVIALDEAINAVFPVGPARETEAVCTLETDRYSLVTRFPTGSPAEQAFESLVIFSPQNTGFVCIEPVSYVVGRENTKRTFRGRILLAPSLPGE